MIGGSGRMRGLAAQDFVGSSRSRKRRPPGATLVPSIRTSGPPESTRRSRSVVESVRGPSRRCRSGCPRVTATRRQPSPDRNRIRFSNRSGMSARNSGDAPILARPFAGIQDIPRLHPGMEDRLQVPPRGRHRANTRLAQKPAGPGRHPAPSAAAPKRRADLAAATPGSRVQQAAHRRVGSQRPRVRAASSRRPARRTSTCRWRFRR